MAVGWCRYSSVPRFQRAALTALREGLKLRDAKNIHGQTLSEREKQAMINDAISEAEGYAAILNITAAEFRKIANAEEIEQCIV